MNLEEKLKDKKVLLFCVKTFNYEVEIKKKIESYGAEVYYYDERPKDSHFVRGLIRLKRSLYEKKIEKYYQDILDSDLCSKIDFLLVIRGEVVPDFFLKNLKKKNPKCKLIFYTWDSFKNHSHPQQNLHHYHLTSSFDQGDCKEYNMIYRPLFYLDVYKKIKPTSFEECSYMMLFIGTAHSDRYKISNALAREVISKGHKVFTYYFMHSRAVYFFKRLFEKGFGHVKYSELAFKSISSNQVTELYKKSLAVLDIQHPNQSGLTMRTFETLGSGRKLITTNKIIKNYDFYNENNVYIIDRENPTVNFEFYKKPFLPYSKDVLSHMSMEGWLHDLISRC